MIDQGFGVYITIVFIMVVLLIASIFIPFYGFVRKRWKGLAIGCLLQPIFCALVALAFGFCISIYGNRLLNRHREAAMVTIGKTDADGFSHRWYVKANEECFYEYKNAKEDEDEDEDEDENENKNENDIEDTNNNIEKQDFDHNRSRTTKLFDVIPLDSFSVCVDDKIVITFDLGSHKVTATEYDEPLEVVNIDWDKVQGYFESRKTQENR